MPLYDCMPLVTKEYVAELVAWRSYQRNGVTDDLKSFGTVHLGYGIKKLDGRHIQIRPDSPLFMYILGYSLSEDFSSWRAVPRGFRGRVAQATDMQHEMVYFLCVLSRRMNYLNETPPQCS